MASNSAVESIVKDRYGKGAEKQEAALCCPVDYDPKYLKMDIYIPYILYLIHVIFIIDKFFVVLFE